VTIVIASPTRYLDIEHGYAFPIDTLASVSSKRKDLLYQDALWMLLKT
jgi:hypothetical protein